MKKVGLGQWILGLVLFLYTIICLLPVILVVIVSFSSDESINKNGFSFFPVSFKSIFPPKSTLSYTFLSNDLNCSLR